MCVELALSFHGSRSRTSSAHFPFSSPHFHSSRSQKFSFTGFRSYLSYVILVFLAFLVFQNIHHTVRIFLIAPLPSLWLISCPSIAFLHACSNTNFLWCPQLIEHLSLKKRFSSIRHCRLNSHHDKSRNCQYMDSSACPWTASISQSTGRARTRCQSK